jgi:hypothetical protein
VERTIGIWKKRFSCLSMDLQYQPEKVGNIIVACAVLHNMSIDNQEEEDYEPDPGQIPIIPPQNDIQQDVLTRTQFINTYFQ